MTKDSRIPFERTPGGAIVLTEVPAWAELEAREAVEIGDHATVIAEATDVGLRGESPQMPTLKEPELRGVAACSPDGLRRAAC